MILWKKGKLIFLRLGISFFSWLLRCIHLKSDHSGSPWWPHVVHLPWEYLIVNMFVGINFDSGLVFSCTDILWLYTVTWRVFPTVSWFHGSWRFAVLPEIIALYADRYQIVSHFITLSVILAALYCIIPSHSFPDCLMACCWLQNCSCLWQYQFSRSSGDLPPLTLSKTNLWNAGANHGQDELMWSGFAFR